MKRFFILSDVADVCEIINAISIEAAMALFKIHHPNLKIQTCLPMADGN